MASLFWTMRREHGSRTMLWTYEWCVMAHARRKTSSSVNSYNPVIYQFFMPLAHRPSAYTFCFLGKFDILSPDEIESLPEKLVTLYQDDIEHRFSNELLQFVDYSNEFLDYAEYTIIHFLYKLTIGRFHAVLYGTLDNIFYVFAHTNQEF